MGAPSTVLVLFVSVLGLALVDNASGLHLDINPNNPTETTDTHVQFGCYLGQDIQDISEIYVMDIIKDKKQQIAVLKQTGITFKHDSIEKRIEAVGTLNNNDISKTYLNLTLLLPRVEDSGSYSCAISYMDKDGLPKQAKYTTKLIVKPTDKTSAKYLETVVNSLVRRVESLEKSNDQKEQDKKDLEASFKKEKDDLVKKVTDLERKVGYKSVFSAMLKEKNARTPLTPNKVIVFDDVVLREGQGYNEKTGTFTAPKKGLYVFHLIMGTWSKTSSFTDVGLTVNGKVKARLQTTNFNANNSGDQDQTEISLVVVLNPYDRVQALTSADTTSDEQMLGSLCTFSGYLVRLDQI